MTMPSSAGFRNPLVRAPLWLAAVPLAALAVSLFLAYLAAPSPMGHVVANLHSTGGARTGPQTVPPLVPAIAWSAQPAQATLPLQSLLTPWAYGVDALALFGLIAALVAHRATARRVGRERR